jgi:TraM recognition site of TraD and TraG
MLMALDEVRQICPVPLPLWMADSAGKGILIVAVCHGLAQLEARWHGPGARAIWDTAGIKVILGGVSDPDTLDRLSRLCGEVALRRHTWTRDYEGRRARTVTHQDVRVLPPELLRTLPEWRALVLRGNLFPVVVRLRMAWRRRDYRRARRIAVGPRPVVAVDRVRSPLPGPSGMDDGTPRPGDGGSGNREVRPAVPGELAERRILQGPAADWKDTPETPRQPPPGEGSVPRPRRPWDPPTDSGDHS